MLVILGMMASCKKEDDVTNRLGFYTIECSECLADFNVNGETKSMIVFGKFSTTFVNHEGVKGIWLNITPLNHNQNIRFSFGHGHDRILNQSHTIDYKVGFTLSEYLRIY